MPASSPGCASLTSALKSFRSAQRRYMRNSIPAPVLRFDASRARMQDDDGIAAVVFSAEQRRRLDGVQTVFERLYFGGDLFFDGLAFSGELEERLQVGNHARKLFIGLDGLGQTLALRAGQPRCGRGRSRSRERRFSARSSLIALCSPGRQRYPRTCRARPRTDWNSRWSSSIVIFLRLSQAADGGRGYRRGGGRERQPPEPLAPAHIAREPVS